MTVRAIVSGLCIVWCGFGFAGGKTVLAERGKQADCTIVLPTDSGPSLVYAAEEFQRYTERMTGVKLPIVRRGETFVGRPIVLNLTDAYGDDGFRLQAGKKGAFEISGGRRGVLYGVYEVLETYGGCGWYASWHEIVPERQELSVPDGLDDIQKPALEMRGTTWKDVLKNEDFAARLRLNAHPVDGGFNFEAKHGGTPIRFVEKLPNCHTFGRILSAQRYFKDHPEWFSEVLGIRRDGRTQICLTNPEASEQAFSNVCEFVDRDLAKGKTVLRVEDALIAGISQSDWHNYCECTNCKAIDDREGAHSGSLLHFVNRLADRLAAKYPGMKTETLIYQYTRKAPKSMRPNDNVIPCICSIECSFANPLADRDIRENAQFMDDLEEWGRLSKNLYVWDYTMMPHHYFYPFPNTHSLGPNIRTFRDNGVRYLFEQGGPTYGDFAQLKAWLIAKFAWNADQPLEPLLDRFFKGHYGAAAPYIREYFDRVESAVVGKANMRYRIWEQDRPDLYPDAFVDWARGVFTKAEAAVKDDPVRLKNVRIQAFVPVCLHLDRRGRETKWYWVTRNPATFKGCEDVQDDLKLAFGLSEELFPKGGRLQFSESPQYNAENWRMWEKMRDFTRPEKGCDAVTLGVRDLIHVSADFGVFVKDPDAFRGESMKVFNSEDWRGPVRLSFGNVAYDSDTAYVVRFRAKVDKAPNGVGEAFNAEFAGQRIAPKVAEVKDGWQWYEYQPTRLADSQVFEYKSGRFDKGGGRCAVNCSYIDRLEIRRK